MAVKDFNPESGDAAYTMGIVDLLLECVELSYRPGKYLRTFANHRCISSEQK
jgi:hypothetical protein